MEVPPGRVDVGFLPSPGWSVPQPGGDSLGDVEETILPRWYWQLLVVGDFSGINLLMTAKKPEAKDSGIIDIGNHYLNDIVIKMWKTKKDQIPGPA